MRRTIPFAAVSLLLAACTADPAAQRPATGSTPPVCEGPQRVEADGRGCVAVRRFGQATSHTLIVMLHGDVSSGGPANYHFPFARRIADRVPDAAVVALVRPGYPDGAGHASTGTNYNRTDQYTAENMDIMAGAIRALKRETGATRVIGVGHSGGAATIANILARDPGLIDAAALLACNCNIAAWRDGFGRQPWTRSLDPYRLADSVPTTAQVIGYTGANDTNAFPSQKRSYIERLSARGVRAEMRIVPGAGHNSIDAMWQAGLSDWVAREASRRPTS
jgi:predicted esterase